MLLVILGAGASNDLALPTTPWFDATLVPPLTDDLLADTDANRRILAELPGHAAGGLVATLRPKIARKEGSLETLLDEIVATEGETTRELVALRLYLQALLARSSEGVISALGTTTNHAAMVRTIERWRRRRPAVEPVLYVTFNYDTILDQALIGEYGWRPGSPGDNLDAYLSHPAFRLFKLHGSINWGQLTSTRVPWGSSTPPGLLSDVPRMARAALLSAAASGGLQLTEGDVRLLTASGSSELDWSAQVSPQEQVLLLPALAVPLAKKAAYTCPARHVDALRSLLRGVDRILTIGWKAGEKDFVQDLLSVRDGTLIEAVNRSSTTRAAVRGALMANVDRAASSDDGRMLPAAFSDFIDSGRLDDFLNRPTRWSS